MRGSVTDRSNEAGMEGRAEARGRTEPCGHERKRTPERRVPQGHRLNGHTHERRAEGCADREKKNRYLIITDAGGTTAYRYGKLGEAAEETRTVRRRRNAGTETLTAATGYAVNYLGQIERIVYPDGETVSYGYDAGGNVESVRGSHYGHTFLYVTDMGYDEQGGRLYIDYGTGVRTEYEYDQNRRWLSAIETTKGSRTYQNISYSFDAVGNVLGYENDCTSGGNYSTSQSYSYDALYQLVGASGSSTCAPYHGTAPVYTAGYTQSYTYDILGNMTEKTSSQTVSPPQAAALGDDLNYTLTYSYAEGFAHRLSDISGMPYEYDAGGSIVREGGAPAGGGSSGGDDDDFDWDDDDGTGGTGGGDGWGIGTGSGSSGTGTGSGGPGATVSRTYAWDERGLMTESTRGGIHAWYAYGADGERTNKWTSDGESIYFSRLWTWRQDGSLDGMNAKHIYLGDTRLVTKLNGEAGHGSYSGEYHNTYYWHTDHLGSAQLITDWQGNEYRRIEYTPYGETWIEKAETTEYIDGALPYRFTGKELDEETGLYYYGARYLDPKYSVWTSADPALGDWSVFAIIKRKSVKLSNCL